ncbi:hypothetical protein WQ54_09530 [Bacillus sp. SA1-12]|uniref:response regulator transcription factor n=1 Tax=Bacillus sp. SA1-12 TaxID=1455638 RepID=UPI000625624E|nr:response regulator transcription factor [Bacillus sp. SA1-12]KKI92404.1 hypothetical protein WQ54_09530 [Bacillus sp. SA1-12]
MFRVMIVDDEPTTRQGLVKIVPWENYGFKVIDTAATGNEAIEKFHNASPHLMIVDMKMPGLSGIELIEKIWAMGENVHFLILSGHAEFQYAKKAIKYNVKGYLLKPVDEDEVINYLKEIKSTLEQESEYQKMKVKIEQEDKESVIQAALIGEPFNNINSFKFYDQLQTYQLLLIKPEQKNNIDLIMLKKKIWGFFEKSKCGVVFIIKSYLGILLNAELEFSKNPDGIYRDLKKLMDDYHLDFISALSNPFKDLEELPKHFQSTTMLISRKFFLENGTLLTESTDYALKDENNNTNSEFDQFHLSHAVEKLVYAMEIEDRNAIESICREIGLQMIKVGYSEYDFKKKFIEIVSSLLHKLMYEYQEIRGIISNVLSMIYEIENQRDVKQLLNYVNELITKILDKLDVDKTDVLVKKMIYLIERNYDKNIKLETLSELLHYSRTYLGKLFKSYTGEHFNTYLDKVRIENGKKLLMQGYKVYQVSERVGFSSVDYFHSKFKKYVGMSPSDFRKKNVKE